MRHILLCFGVVALLAGCAAPFSNVPRLDDVSLSTSAASVAERPSEARRTGGGLFGRLLNRAPDDPTNAAVDAALQDVAPQPSRASATPRAERGGLFGIFRRTPDSAPAIGNGPDSADVPAGSVMPFGEIGRVCGLGANQLGTQIDSAAGFRIYDTIPSTTSPRPFYITGFDDNCARTFTGAVVVPGDIETHEFVRYQTSNARIAYTTVDNAYEAMKANVCRVGRGQPCGARAQQLGRNTHFITVYSFFAGTFSSVPTEWAQILVHDGKVLGMSIQEGGI